MEPLPAHLRPTTLGDRISDIVQWTVGGFLALGILVGLLRLLGLTWSLAPFALLLGALFWAVLLVVVRAALRTPTSSTR